MTKAELMNGRKISSFIGLPIFSLNRGKKLGYVKQVVYDGEKNKLLAFTIEERGVISPHRLVLTFDQVHSIGYDAVMVEDERVFKTEKDSPDIRDILRRDVSIIGKRILTESGTELGNIRDILVNDETGAAISYEVSAGLAKDIRGGLSYIEAPKAQTVGVDAVIVPDEVEIILAGQAPGGMLGAFEQARASGAAFGEQVSTYTQEQEINLSKGKTAGRDVYDDQSGLIVTKGETITDRVINEAVAKDKMHDVALAAGVGGLSGAYTSASQAVSSGYSSATARMMSTTAERTKGKRVPYDITDETGVVVIPKDTTVTDETITRANEGNVMNQLTYAVLGSTARTGAESFWTETKDWFTNAWNNLTEATQKSASDYGRQRAVSDQKNFLRGKISSVNITDKSGNTILREGDVITPLVLDTLDRQGLLEMVTIKAEPGFVTVGRIKEEPEVHVVLETAQQHDEHKSHI